MTFRHFVLALVSLVLAAAPFTAHAEQWSAFEPEGAGYSVELPGKPATETETVDTPVGRLTSHVAELDLGATGYICMYTIYPDGAVPEVGEALDRAKAGMLETGTAEVREESNLTIGTAPARRLVLYDTQTKLQIVSLQVFARDRLYQLMYAAPPHRHAVEESRRFFDSFKLIPF